MRHDRQPAGKQQQQQQQQQQQEDTGTDTGKRSQTSSVRISQQNSMAPILKSGPTFFRDLPVLNMILYVDQYCEIGLVHVSLLLRIRTYLSNFVQ